MTEQEEADLLSQGQAMADEQTLEVLLTGGERFAEFAASLGTVGVPLEDAAQLWRGVLADVEAGG